MKSFNVCIQNVKLNLEATARETATAQSQLLKLYMRKNCPAREPQLQEYFFEREINLYILSR